MSDQLGSSRPVLPSVFLPLLRSVLIGLGCLSQVSVMGQESHTTQWPMFRGPAGLAVGMADSLPLEFNDQKNALWHLETPRGHSSPK